MSTNVSGLYVQKESSPSRFAKVVNDPESHRNGAILRHRLVDHGSRDILLSKSWGDNRAILSILIWR
jgi:hypothetical protein